MPMPNRARTVGYESLTTRTTGTRHLTRLNLLPNRLIEPEAEHSSTLNWVSHASQLTLQLGLSWRASWSTSWRFIKDKKNQATRHSNGPRYAKPDDCDAIDTLAAGRGRVAHVVKVTMTRIQTYLYGPTLLRYTDPFHRLR